MSLRDHQAKRASTWGNTKYALPLEGSTRGLIEQSDGLNEAAGRATNGAAKAAGVRTDSTRGRELKRAGAVRGSSGSTPRDSNLTVVSEAM